MAKKRRDYLQPPFVDPARSRYAEMEEAYVAKVTAFYAVLGVRSALWTTPATVRPKYFERCKPIEYLLEVKEDRVLAYLDESGWTEYLLGRRADSEYSCTPRFFDMTSILVAVPIRRDEVKAKRRYRSCGRPDSYIRVSEETF